MTQIRINPAFATGVQVGGHTRKRADQSVTSATTGTTLVDCTDLALFLEPHEVWWVTVTLLINSDATPDTDIKFTAPSGATFQWGMVDAFPTAPNTLATQLTIAGTGATQLQMLVGVVVNSATEGNLQLRFAQKNSDAAATTIEANSNIVAQLIADPEDSVLK